MEIQVQRKASYTLGLATEDDGNGVFEVAKLLFERPKLPNSGFLLGYSTLEEYRRDCKDGNIFVAKEAGKVVGFIGCHTLDHPVVLSETRLLPEVSWDEGVTIDLKRTLYLSAFGVHPDFQGRGIGRALEELVLKSFPDKDFLGGIVEAPISNDKSARFHQNHGFKRVGVFRAKEAFGMKDYQSGIYLKVAK